MDMRISPLELKIMLEQNPLKSRVLVRRLAVLVIQTNVIIIISIIIIIIIIIIITITIIIIII